MPNPIYRYTLSSPAASEVLTVNPAGWNELGIRWQRSDVYHSVMRMIGATLRFTRKTGGGGEFIINEYDQNGINGNMTLLIEKVNPYTNNFETFITGDIDYSPERFKITRDYVEAGFIDSGIEQKFYSRDEIDIDINQTVSIDDATIDAFANSHQIDFLPIDIILNSFSSGTMNRVGFIINDPADELEINYTGEHLVNEIGERLLISDTPADRFIYENTTDETVKIAVTELIGYNETSILYTPTVAGNNYIQLAYTIQIALYDETDTIVVALGALGEVVFMTEKTDILVPETETLKKQYNLVNPAVFGAFSGEVLPGYKLGFYTLWYTITPSNPNNITALLTQNFTIESLKMYEQSTGEATTTVNCYFPHEAFTRLIQLITSETDETKLFYSTFFGRTDSEFETYTANGEGALDAITTGWNLRSFPNKSFILNFRDLFKTFDAIYNLGCGYDRTNERFYIEQKDEFYKSGTLIANIGEVSELEIIPIPEQYYNQVISGIKGKQEYEQYQGAHEFNCPVEHTLPFKVKNTKDIQQTYNTDSIGMELARRKQYLTYASQDTKYDENIYIVRTDGSETLQGDGNPTGFQGVELYYNIRLTPRENLIRWSNVLNAALWKSVPKVKFQKADKNTNISYVNQNGITVNEHDDLTNADLTGAKLFKPELYRFQGIINPAIVQAINDDPHGLIQFTFDSTTYYGFINSVETADYNEKANYELIGYDAESENNYLFEDENEFLFEDDDEFVYND